MFVGLQANNIADNIIKAGDGAGYGDCSHNYFIGELITGRVTLGWDPSFQEAHGPHNPAFVAALFLWWGIVCPFVPKDTMQMYGPHIPYQSVENKYPQIHLNRWQDWRFI